MKIITGAREETITFFSTDNLHSNSFTNMQRGKISLAYGTDEQYIIVNKERVD